VIHILEIQAEAVIDIQEAFEWYEAQRSGLGVEFIEELESSYDDLCNHPQHYTSINEQFRRLKVNRFPYLIIYEIEGLKVIVNSVRHSSRQPKF
jgi:plasmid stabilization system protein ParE